MKVRKIKKYIFYLTALMPFLMMLFDAVYWSFTNNINPNGTFFTTLNTLLTESFLLTCDAITPNFFDFRLIFDEIFSLNDIWGDALVSYFGYFVAICLYNILIEVVLFFVYLFESWVNKIEKDF